MNLPPAKMCLNCAATIGVASKLLHERDRLQTQIDGIRLIYNEWHATEERTAAYQDQALIMIGEILDGA